MDLSGLILRSNCTCEHSGSFHNSVTHLQRSSVWVWWRRQTGVPPSTIQVVALIL